MALNKDALILAIKNHGEKTKAAIDAAVEQTNVLMDEMSDELQRQILELGNPAGGVFTVATVEAFAALTGNEIDVGLANHYAKTITANTAFTLTNIPVAGRVATFIMHVTNGGAFSVSWWANVKWAEGAAPALSTAGRDVIGFSTRDGGATWDGYLIGKDMKAAA